MQATAKRSSLAARSLKTIGVILIISSLIDYLIIPIPYQFLDIQWRIGVASTLVDRGIVPMIGIGLMFAGYKMDSDEGKGAVSPKKWMYLPFWGLILSAVLGFVFLLLTPVHLNDVRMASAQELENINSQARQAETRLNAQLGSEEFQTRLEQEQQAAKEQFKALLSDPERLKTVIESKDTPDDVKEALKAAQNDPASLDKFFEERVADIPTRLTDRLKEEETTRRQQISREASKSAIRIGLSSFLLAIGYLTIAWTGLKGMMRPRR